MSRKLRVINGGRSKSRFLWLSTLIQSTPFVLTIATVDMVLAAYWFKHGDYLWTTVFALLAAQNLYSVWRRG